MLSGNTELAFWWDFKGEYDQHCISSFKRDVPAVLSGWVSEAGEQKMLLFGGLKF